MNISEMQAAKAEAEAKIVAAVQELQDATGLLVSGVIFDWDFTAKAGGRVKRAIITASLP